MSAELEAQLSAYLDGELSEDEEGRLREAIAASPELARKLVELESVDGALAALPVPAVPAGARARLRARIAAEKVAPGARPPRPRRRLMVMAAVAAAAAVLAWLVLPGTGDDAPFVAKQPAPIAPAPKEAPDPIAELPKTPQIAKTPTPEAIPVADLPDLLAPDDAALDLAAELDVEDLAVVEVLEWLAALEGLEPDEGRG